MNRTLNLITLNLDLDKNQKEKIKNFYKVRRRMIQMKVNNGNIGKIKLALISQFLTFLGCGKIRTAPGTFTSFITIVAWFFATSFFAKINLSPLYENLFWFSFIVIMTFYSIILIPIYTRDFKNDDHPSIVMDEVVGQLIALCLTYPFVREFYQQESWMLTKIVIFTHLSLNFLLFRIFDISKPWVIGWLDRNVKNPFGVMLDDIIAGIFAAVINTALFLFYKNSIIQLHGF